MINRRSYILFLVLFLLCATPETYAAFPVKQKTTETVATGPGEQKVKATTPFDINPPAPAPKDPANSQRNTGPAFGIVALVAGIVGLVVAALPMGIIAIIFGALGMNREMRGLAIAGFVLGIIDIIGGFIILASMDK